MLISKKVWNLVVTGLQPIINKRALWDHWQKEDQMANGIAIEIIQSKVSDNFFKNIIDEKDFKLMTVCS